MSPTPGLGPVRPAATADELNRRIRELWADGVLPQERRGEYHQLVVEWAQADQAERRGLVQAA